MDPIITFVISSVISFVILHFVINTGFKIYKEHQKQKFKALVKNIEKAFTNIIPVLYTEVESNTIYLYEKKTNKFQCQATTLEDLAKELGNGKFIAKVLHDNKELWFVEGEVLDEVIITTEVK